MYVEKNVGAFKQLYISCLDKETKNLTTSKVGIRPCSAISSNSNQSTNKQIY